MVKMCLYFVKVCQRISVHERGLFIRLKTGTSVENKRIVSYKKIKKKSYMKVQNGPIRN